MLDVRSRAGVIAVTTSAAFLVGLPVVAFGQVPIVEPVVNGVTETADSIVQAPVAPPPLPAPPAPVPAPPPAPAAPAPAPAPQVQLPAAPSAPKPAAQPPAAPAPAAGNAGAVQTRGAGAASKRSGGGGKEAAHRSAKAADRSAKRGEHRGDRAKAKASGDAGPTPAEEQAAGGSEAALASQEADALPDDASPAKLPFSGLQLALMAIAGLAALMGGTALRRGVLRSQRPGIVP
jgi:hypothetical protein